MPVKNIQNIKVYPAVFGLSEMFDWKEFQIKKTDTLEFYLIFQSNCFEIVLEVVHKSGQVKINF